MSDSTDVQFVLALSRALQVYGAPAHRLEGAMSDVLESLGMRGSVFSMPTGIMISLDNEAGHHVEMLRISETELELGKLSELIDLSYEVIRKETTPGEGLLKIESILEAPPRYGTLLTIAAFALTSAAASRLFGAGLPELLAAFAVGLVVGLLATAAGRVPFIGRLFDPLAGFSVSLVAVGAASLITPLSVPVVTVAGLIILVPGLTLTIAISELAQNNLVSGTARLHSALVVFLMLGFGVAAGGRLAIALFGRPDIVAATALPLWTEAAAVLVACLTLTILMRVPMRDFPYVVLTAVGSYLGVRFASPVAGPELGVFVGALIAGSLSNIHAHNLERPVALTRLPSIMLLVPGGLGFTGITHLLEQNVLEGMKTAFSVAIIAVSLVIGLIISNSIVPPGRRI